MIWWKKEAIEADIPNFLPTASTAEIEKVRSEIQRILHNFNAVNILSLEDNLTFHYLVYIWSIFPALGISKDDDKLWWLEQLRTQNSHIIAYKAVDVFESWKIEEQEKLARYVHRVLTKWNDTSWVGRYD